MSASLASFKATVEKLVRPLESDGTHYPSKGYPEAEARADFVTPFFKAPGWDVQNEAGLPHFGRGAGMEHRDADAPRRADYSFRVGGEPKSFAPKTPMPQPPVDGPCSPAWKSNENPDRWQRRRGTY